MERTKNALECKQGHPMTMEHQRGGGPIFQIRKVLNEVQQDGGKRKKHYGDDNKESILIME